MIKALFLDLDHTLCDTYGADDRAYDHTLNLATRLNSHIDCTALRSAYTELVDTEPWDPESVVPVVQWRTTLWARALKRQGVDNTGLARQLHDCFYQQRIVRFKFFDGVTDMLTSLRRDYTLIIVTNGDTAIQRPKLKACNANDFVDHILISGELRIDKPDPGIFQKACEFAGCAAAEAIHAGDSLKSDVQGGINAGLAATVWVNPGAGRPAPEPKPDFEITTILELPKILAKLQ